MEPSRENCRELIEQLKQERKDTEFPWPFIMDDVEKFLEEAVYWLPPQTAVDRVREHMAKKGT